MLEPHFWGGAIAEGITDREEVPARKLRRSMGY